METTSGFDRCTPQRFCSNLRVGGLQPASRFVTVAQTAYDRAVVDAPAEKPGKRALISSRNRTSFAVLGLYFLCAFVYFGIRVAAHPGRDYIGNGVDSQIFIWSLGWWPHAILHGENPLVAHAVWAPTGVNTTWITSIPGLAIPLAPLTIIAGPVVAYNTASVLIPALAAWTAYLLCRYVTKAFWPSVLGGYLFGFSSYVLGQELGHMNLSAIFLIPLIALVILRYLDGLLDPRGLVIRLGVLIAGQILISTEVAVTVTIAIIVATAIAKATRARRGLGTLIYPLAGSYLLAALLTSPFLVYLLLGYQSTPVNGPDGWHADLANFAVPTRLIAASNSWARTLSAHFAGNYYERGAYLGIPSLLIVAWFAVLWIRKPAGRFLLVSLGAAVVAALGTTFAFTGGAGKSNIPMPWWPIAKLPALDNVLPVRLTVYAALATAVIVAIWATASRIPVPVRIVGGILAALALVPNVRLHDWYTAPDQPGFFADGLYRHWLQPDENVIILPYTSNGNSMLWQAESDFYFTMTDGYVRPHPPPSFMRFPAVAAMDENAVPPNGTADVQALVQATHVNAIIVDAQQSDPWRALLAPLGQPFPIGGVLLYRLSGPSVSASSS
jgi:hypothetical protein